MCGIVGVLALGDRSVESDWLERMVGRLSHRGPDDQGFWVNQRVGLGHCRLAMLDLEGSQQPFSDGGIQVAANAEIYNHQHLRTQLKARGHVACSGAGDMAVLAPLYREFGLDFAGHLVGMFALALWDPETTTLVLARDRFGIKPLYYYQDSQFLAFASELGALLAFPHLKPALNLRALDQYCRFKTVLDPETMLQGVRQLSPGSLLLAGPKGVTLQPYTKPRQLAPSVAEALHTSVEQCLVSDQPLGVFLSGGIDSSVVAALVVELTGSATTFSLGFKEGLWDESAYSQQVADHLQTHHHPLLMTAQHGVEAALALSQGLDQPLADESALACYFLAQQARQHVKGVLTGDGGDEVFAGYPWHRPGPSFAGQVAPVVATITGWNLFECRQRALLYRPELAKRLSGLDLFSQLALDTNALKESSGLKASLLIDRGTSLLSYLLVKTDRTSMLNSLEVRLPMLNHPLVDTVDYRMRDDLVDKVLLRQAFGHLLPEAVVKRPKKGFGVPLGVWMWQPGPFRDMIYSRLKDSQALLWDYLEPNFVGQLLSEHERVPRHGHLLWALFILEGWLQRIRPSFVDSAG